MPQATKPVWKLCAASAMEAEWHGQFIVAEQQYKVSLSLARQARGGQEDVGEACINLADFYMNAERYEESRLLYREALANYDSAFGRDNLVTAMIYRMLAAISTMQNRDSEASVFQARAHDIFEQRQAP